MGGKKNIWKCVLTTDTSEQVVVLWYVCMVPLIGIHCISVGTEQWYLYSEINVSYIEKKERKKERKFPEYY